MTNGLVKEEERRNHTKRGKGKTQGMQMSQEKKIWVVLSFLLAWRRSRENYSFWGGGKNHL